MRQVPVTARWHETRTRHTACRESRSEFLICRVAVFTSAILVDYRLARLLSLRVIAVKTSIRLRFNKPGASGSWRNKVCKTFLFKCHVLPLANYQKIKVYRLEMAETDRHFSSCTPCRDLRGIPLTLNRSSCEKTYFTNLDNIHRNTRQEKLDSPARVRITGLDMT